MHNNNDPASASWLLMPKSVWNGLDARFAARADDDEFTAFMDELKGKGNLLHLTPFQMAFVREQCRTQGLLVEGFDHPKLPDPKSFGVLEDPQVDLTSAPESLQKLISGIGGFIAEITQPKIDTESPAWTAYKDQCRAILSAQAEVDPSGIPDFKLHCPSQWEITPNELRPAIARAKDEWQGEIVADSGQAADRASLIHRAFTAALFELCPSQEDFTFGGEVVLYRAIELLRTDDMATPDLGQANDLWRSFVHMMRRAEADGGLIVA